MRLDAKQEPAVRMINGVLFALFAGDLEPIENLFEVDGKIHDNNWSVTLKARQLGLAKIISGVALDGGARQEHHDQRNERRPYPHRVFQNRDGRRGDER